MIVPVANAGEKAIAQAEGESILTQIRVVRPTGSVQENLLQADIDRIAAIDGVVGLIPGDSATLYSCDDDDRVQWGATVLVADPASLPTDIPAAVVKNLADDQIIPPASLEGEDMTVWIGKPMPATFIEKVDDHTGESRDITLTVVATYPTTWSPPYPGTVYANQALVIRLLSAEHQVPQSQFLSVIGFSRVVVNVRSTDVVDFVAKQIRDQGFDAYPLRDSLGSLPETIEMLPGLITLLGFVSLLCATIFVVFITRSTLRKRIQEFGLLRMRGWQKSDILRLVVADVCLGAAFGAALGTLLGLVGGVFLANATLGAFSFSPNVILITSLIWVGLLTLAGITALAAALVGLRRDPFIAIMMPA